MDRKKISRHEVEVFHLLHLDLEKWHSVQDLAAALKDKNIADRTVRLHVSRFAQAGLLEIAEIFPAKRYRLMAKGGDVDYRAKLEQTEAILGLHQNGEKKKDTPPFGLSQVGDWGRP